MKRFLVMLCIAALLLTACGRQWVCDSCEKNFRGAAYTGYYGTETYCEDCARRYWAPFSYKEFKK
jgi:hypothetical protein